MNLIPVKTPNLIKGLFPKYIWNMPQDQKIIYLTFDDGPTPEITNWTLDLLKSYQAKATFFCIGNNIEKYSAIVQDILNGGHVIGNHTFHHPKGWRTNAHLYVEGVLRTQQLIDQQVSQNLNPKSQNRIIDVEDQLGLKNENHIATEKGDLKGYATSKLFRPPYGQITPKQGNQLIKLGYKIIMWDILAFDWENTLTREQCAANVISKSGNGSIVVFHDSLKASERMKYALTKTLEHFSQEGYQFKSIVF